MDIVHHTLIGGVGYLAATACDQQLAGAAFLAGSVLPDLDVFFMLFGKRFYLKNHQGITHSLILAPLYALLICGMVMFLFYTDWNWWLFGGALLGLCLHVFMDWFNTFRIALFSPFISKRYSLDTVFFIDSVTLFLTGMFYLFYGYYKIDAAVYAYPLLFMIYFVFKLFLRLWTMRIHKPLFAIPSSLNPFEFYILIKDSKGSSGFLYNCISKNSRNFVYYAPVAEKYEQLAERSPVFRDMRHITRAFSITNVLETSEGTIIHAGDLPIRNFGGRFAKTVLRFDKQNKLVHETANI